MCSVAVTLNREKWLPVLIEALFGHTLHMDMYLLPSKAAVGDALPLTQA